MAFPETVLPLTVELQLDGTWVDITDYVNRRDGMVAIARGRSDEGAQVDHGRCAMTLNNRDGRYSSRNPVSPYYGQLTRNTPLRVSLESGDVHLAPGPEEADRITAPDAVALGITGDIDIRIEVEADDWRGEAGLAGKYTASGDQRSWALIYVAGYLTFLWSPNGTLASRMTAVATMPTPAPGGGRQAVRVTLDVNNGASGNTVTFYTSDSISGSWTQLGDPVVTAGTTSVFDSSASVEVGNVLDITIAPLRGQVYAFQLRSGIGGSVVANPDFTIQTPGDNAFADTASSPNTWTVQGNAAITQRRYRFAGEVSSWPQRWDSTGTDVYVPVEAAGIMRRLGQGAPVLGSPLYRGRLLNDAASLVAYWPFEDAEGSTSMAPALDHGAMTIIGSPEFASNEDFPGSAALPVLNGAEMRGSVPAYTDTGQTQVRFVLSVPAGGAEDGQVVAMWYTTGSVRRWEVFYESDGDLGLRGFDASGATLFTSLGVGFEVNGTPVMVSAELTQNGADIDWTIAVLNVPAREGEQFPGTLAGNTVGRVGTVAVSPGGGIAECAVGHVSVQTTISTIFDLADEASGWVGETAARRVERLCEEEGIAHRPIGDSDDSTRMGVQRPARLLDLLRECATADGGMLFEPRATLGIGYRTRVSLYNQQSAVALDYDAGDLAGSLEPVDDDQATRNDVTVTREEGSSARAVLETGALSVLPPPDGVGRYEDNTTINVQYDLDLFDQAGWRLHLGTVDEARYPTIEVNLARDAITGDADLTAAIVGADVGDLVSIADPPAWLPPEDIVQMVQGYTETLGNFEWEIRWNCSPASPYTVATYDGTARYGPHDTITAEDLDTTETGVNITTPTGPLWSTTATGYQIIIGGEVMTVTAVGAPSGSNQTLTVTRSVNGVVKSHASGVEVRMFQPAVYAL